MLGRVRATGCRLFWSVNVAFGPVRPMVQLAKVPLPPTARTFTVMLPVPLL